MNKFEAFLIGCIFAAMIAMHPADADTWPLDRDTQLHLMGSTLISIVVTPLFADTSIPVLGPFLTSAGAGLAKEYVDKNRTKQPLDMHDIKTDLAGAAIGTFLGSEIQAYPMHKGIMFAIKGTFTTSKPEGEK